MQVSDEHINKMLQNLPPDQAAQFASIIRGEVESEIVCTSQDTYEEQDVPLFDENEQPVLYKTGKRKGEQKTKKESVLVQEGCKGRVIAQLMTDGQIVPVNDPNGNMYLRSSRRRTDGEIGFECWCGNDTRVASNEDGILKADGSQPTKEDLLNMAAKLEQNPPSYATIKGERDVDGFILRKVGN